MTKPRVNLSNTPTTPMAAYLTSRDQHANSMANAAKQTILDVPEKLFGTMVAPSQIAIPETFSLLPDEGSLFKDNSVPASYLAAELFSHIEKKDYSRIPIDYPILKQKWIDFCQKIRSTKDRLSEIYAELKWWKDSQNITKVVSLAQNILQKYPSHRICSLGQSPAWIVKACQVLQEKRGADVNVGYIPYSKQIMMPPLITKDKATRYYIFYRNQRQLPSLEACRSYMNYLKAMGLSPEDIIENARKGKKTLILEYAESGAGLASFLSLLVLYAQQHPDQTQVSVSQLLKSIDIVALNVPTRRHPLTTIMLQDVIPDQPIKCESWAIPFTDSWLLDTLSRNDTPSLRYLPSYSDELWLSRKYYSTFTTAEGKKIVRFPEDKISEINRPDRIQTSETREIINLIRAHVGLSKLPDIKPPLPQTLMSKCMSYCTSLVKFMMRGKRKRAEKRIKRLNSVLPSFVDKLNKERERAFERSGWSKTN